MMPPFGSLIHRRLLAMITNQSAAALSRSKDTLEKAGASSTTVSDDGEPLSPVEKGPTAYAAARCDALLSAPSSQPSQQDTGIAEAGA
ncbi:hypothetical protein [Streptosporangium canum]|uniref:hypothetical protein n=1 Tax=Streptosporangium canum TaxID=324952 RepID=UPI0037BCE39E